MVDKIIKAISLALNQEFGDGYKNYTEGIEQDMDAPCFFIICSTPRKKLFFGRKYFRSNIFCIQYIPATEDIRAECNGITERLFECLEYINVDGVLLRGTKMEPEVREGTLYFFLNYDFFVYKQDEVEMMGQVSSSIKVKGKVENGSGKKESGE